jgi:hypothetical protein
MTNETRIERKLQTAWDATTDARELMVLRGAFERNATGVDAPVLIRNLTPLQVDRLEDTYTEDHNAVISTGRSWVLVADVDTVHDLIDERDYHLDSALSMALENNIDMTDAQIAFTTRSVTRSVDSAIRRMRSAL